MRHKIMGALMLLAFVVMAPLGLSNEYLYSRDFDTVTVRANENVCSIAARYTKDEHRAAELREAIIEINSLGADGHMRVGQIIRVPVLHRDATDYLSLREGEGE